MRFFQHLAHHVGLLAHRKQSSAIVFVNLDSVGFQPFAKGIIIFAILGPRFDEVLGQID
jgi:hypothetical protein